MGPPPTMAARRPAEPSSAQPARLAPGWIDGARVARIASLCALGALPALLDPGALERASALWPLAEGPRPWWTPEHALLLHLWAPLVAVSGCILLLAPGLALAAALGGATGLGRWILLALGLDLVVLSVVSGAAEALGPGLWRGHAFGGLAAATAAIGFVLLALRVRAGARLPWPATVAPGLVPTLAIPLLLLALLAPKWHWESFNGDGVHAFETVRLLLVQPLPFWSSEAGPISGFPGVTSMLFAFPGAWFVRLLGENEGAARVPVLLYLAGAFGGIAALVEERRGRLPGTDAWLLWGALALYLVVLGFSASYDPYTADLALPATQDTLTVACFLGFVLAFVRGEGLWLALFGALAYVALPSGLMLMGLWLLASWLFLRPRPWQAMALTVGLLVACLLAGRALPPLLASIGLPRPGGEYESLLGRFALVQVSEVRRLLFVAVPCGVAPVLALLAWKRFDPVGRALALAAGAYFLFFYVQAHVSLHHFVPAMLLPLAAFWRSDLVAAGRTRRAALALTAALLPLSLWLSWPKDPTPLVHARRVGQALAMQVGGYERSRPQAFASALVLRHLFPSGMDPSVPARRYGGSPYIWSHYARRGAASLAQAAYVVAPAGAPTPEGASRIGEEQGYALHVLDPRLWEEHSAAALPHPPGAPLYVIDRGLLFFGGSAREGGPRIFDLRAAVRRLGG